MRIKKHTIVPIALAVASLLLLGGCNSILSRDYMVITPHLENILDEVVDDELRAETFQELKDSILRLVEEGYEVGTIRLYNYSGDVDDDTESAITYTMRNEPLGAYAVEYVSYKSVRILSYYEIILTITYRKTPEEIAAIKKADSLEEYRRILIDTYSEYGDLVTVEIPWYYSDQYSVQDILQEYYVENPLKIATAPDITSKEFPDVETGGESGWRRIFEVSFNYFESPDKLKEMTDGLTIELDSKLSGTELPDDNTRFITLKELLIENSEVLSDPEENQERKNNIAATAYAAVINKSATSEGYALAYKAICDMAGIDCLVVQGRLDSLLHSWNLVYTEGEWYHIDIATDDVEPDGQYLLFTDAQMSENGYRWDPGHYPPTGEEAVSAFSPEDTTYTEANEEIE